MAEFKKIVFFDYLRAVAILFIAFYHYVLEATLFHIRPSATMSYVQNLALLDVFRSGAAYQTLGNMLVFFASIGYQFVGVFIFLSGFGLTYSRILKGPKKWGWSKRILRLVPQFQIAIIFAFAINYISLHYLRDKLVSVPAGTISPYAQLLFYPFTNLNFYFAPVFHSFNVLLLGVNLSFYSLISSVNPSLWFSGLILQYYIFYDIYYWFLVKLKVGWFLLLTLVITLGYRFITLHWYDGDPLLFSLLPVRLFEFGLGMGAAYFYTQLNYDLFDRLKWWWFLIGLCFWYLGFRAGFTDMGRIVNDPLTTMGLMLMGIILLRRIRKGWLALVLGAIGTQSYWLYLLHNQPITQMLTPWTFKQWDAHGMSGLVLLYGFVMITAVMTIFSLLLCYYDRYGSRFTKSS